MKKFIEKYRLQIFITMILGALLLIFMATSPRTFLSGRIYIAYMSTIPFSAIMALGMTMVIISGEIDLSFPAVMATAGFVFSAVFAGTGSTSLAVLCGLLTGSFAGLVNGLIVVVIGVPSIIATIGTQFFWRGLTVLVSGGLAKSLIEIRDTDLHYVMTGKLFGTWPAQSLWLIIITFIMWMVLNRHRYGDNLRFVGDNKDAAAVMGIPVGRVRIGVFVLMGFFSALSGIMVCMEMASWWPTQGEGYMLIVFASVFIGGTSVFGGSGTLYGTLIGAVIIGIIEAGIISAGLSGLWTRMVYGIIVILSVSAYALVLKKDGGQ